MRAKVLMITLLVQSAVLAWQVFAWESLLQNGQTIFLRSMPVDPRDPMRGDYLRLNYAANNLPSRLYSGPVPLSSLVRGDTVYTTFEDVAGVAAARAVSAVPPESGLFIKGRLQGSPRSEVLSIHYGLGQLYREQGRALDMELKQRGEDGVPRSLDIEVAVGGSGQALIKGYRWAGLGMAVAVNAGTSSTPVLEVSIHNYSERTVYIPHDTRHCAFQIEVSDPQAQALVFDRPCAASERGQRQAIAAGHTVRRLIDLSDERWQVVSERGTPQRLWRMQPSPRLHLVYQDLQAPTNEAHVRLWSQPFWLPRSDQPSSNGSPEQE